MNHIQKIALAVLTQIFIHHHSLNKIEKNHQIQGITQELIYGVLRYYPQLLLYLNQLLTKKLRPKDQDIQILLLIGMYQIKYMNTPIPVVINETVNAVPVRKKAWAKSLVNAILRKFDPEKFDSKDSFLLHPEWLFKNIQTHWPEYWEKIIDANNQKPPMSLRVNQSQITPSEYLKN